MPRLFNDQSSEEVRSLWSMIRRLLSPKVSIAVSSVAAACILIEAVYAIWHPERGIWLDLLIASATLFNALIGLLFANWFGRFEVDAEKDRLFIRQALEKTLHRFSEEHYLLKSKLDLSERDIESLNWYIEKDEERMTMLVKRMYAHQAEVRRFLEEYADVVTWERSSAPERNLGSGDARWRLRHRDLNEGTQIIRLPGPPEDLEHFEELLREHPYSYAAACRAMGIKRTIKIE